MDPHAPTTRGYSYLHVLPRHPTAADAFRATSSRLHGKQIHFAGCSATRSAGSCGRKQAPDKSFHHRTTASSQPPDVTAWPVMTVIKWGRGGGGDSATLALGTVLLASERTVNTDDPGGACWSSLSPTLSSSVWKNGCTVATSGRKVAPGFSGRIQRAGGLPTAAPSLFFFFLVFTINTARLFSAARS